MLTLIWPLLLCCDIICKLFYKAFIYNAFTPELKLADSALIKTIVFWL